MAQSNENFVVRNESFDSESGIVFADTTITDESKQDDLRARLLRCYKGATEVFLTVLH